MKTKSGATIHTCDGCGASAIQLDNDELPIGFYISVFDVSDTGGNAGDLYVCGEACLTRAFRRRWEIWTQNEERTA